MSDVTVLDGGFSTQLSSHVGEQIDGDPLWTSRFLVTNPESVFATHLDFLRVGCDIIQTNTYQASITGFVKYLGISVESSLDLIRDGAQLAKRAVNLYQNECKLADGPVTNQKPLIAGSCGPYGAALHDGSEYTGSYGKTVSKEAMIDWHRPRIQTLLNAGVDMLALETIPCSVEAEALMELLREFPGIKAWLSFSCDGNRRTLADGTSFVDTALRCYKKAQPEQLIAVGVNCLAPQNVASLLEGINKNRKTHPVPLVVYPNSGEKYTVEKGWTFEGQWHPLENFVHEWLDLGTRYVGGCCRTNAADVIKIRAKVESWKALRRKNDNCSY